MQNSKMSKDRLERELFTEFNKRYEDINDYLQDIIGLSDLEELDTNKLLRNKLNDFFNLCAEEYYWFKKERISKDIWNSWRAAMNYWYSHEIIKLAWERELKTLTKQAYYFKEADRGFFND